MPSFYKIRIEGELNPCWSEWLDDMAISRLDTGETLLSGPLADQAALYGILTRIRDMNLELLSLEKEKT